VDGCDDREVRLAEPAEGLLSESRVFDALAMAYHTRGLHVGPRREGPVTGPREHNCPDLLVSLEGIDRVGQLLEHLLVDSVHVLRPVEDEFPDVLGWRLDANRLELRVDVCHGTPAGVSAPHPLLSQPVASSFYLQCDRIEVSGRAGQESAQSRRWIDSSGDRRVDATNRVGVSFTTNGTATDWRGAKQRPAQVPCRAPRAAGGATCQRAVRRARRARPADRSRDRWSS
jgi:hypothetical protein